MYYFLSNWNITISLLFLILAVGLSEIFGILEEVFDKEVINDDL